MLALGQLLDSKPQPPSMQWMPPHPAIGPHRLGRLAAQVAVQHTVSHNCDTTPKIDRLPQGRHNERVATVHERLVSTVVNEVDGDLTGRKVSR